MDYAIYRMLNGHTWYGKNADGMDGVEIVERFPNLRAASASLKMRNDAVKDMTKLINRLEKSGLATPDYLGMLRGLRDADGLPYGPHALDRLAGVNAALTAFRANLLKSDLADTLRNRKHVQNREKYVAATKPLPGSIDAMTDAERADLRARMISKGWTPRF